MSKKGGATIGPRQSEVTHLNFFIAKSGRGTLLDVGGQVLVDVLEDEVERHLTLATVAVGDVQESAGARI